MMALGRLALAAAVAAVGVFSPVGAAVAKPSAPSLQNLSIEPSLMPEAMALAFEGLAIARRAAEREAEHAKKLAARGIAEEPPSTAALKYTIDTGGLGDFLFDDWGELYIDRRFVTKDELATVKRIEAFVRKNVIEPFLAAQGAKTAGAGAKPGAAASKGRLAPPRATAGGAGLPVFRGFEDARYQQHDALIAAMVRDFNRDRAGWCGGTPQQAAKIADLTPALVKSHMIEESGGRGSRSRAAWNADPLQVNVPGDWGREKELVGLSKPAKRNEGNITNNVRAAIMYLSRKGFGASARPAAERPQGFFDGWPKALQRYNGRRDRTDSDRFYSDEYAEKIVRRAQDPDLFVPIEIKLAKPH